MSVTVSDLMKLPSLQRAHVMGGAGGLNKVVSSVSVLESTDPSVLVNEIFPSDKYNGGEIVITGFLNCLYDVDKQCSNMRRLIEGGEVGLVLYYVGIYLPRVDERLIEMANEHDFVLICMPEGQGHLRYSDFISDVMECICRDRANNASLVSDILARISSAPHAQQTVGTALDMLSTELGCSAVLSTHEGSILNISTWPRGMDDPVRESVESAAPLTTGRTYLDSPLLHDAELFSMPIKSDLAQPLQLTLIKVGASLSAQLADQAADIVRICVNIWGRQHGEVAIHELMRAILQDEPLKMRRLADIFHVDVAALHELWMLCSADAYKLEERIPNLIALTKPCTEIAIGAIFEEMPVMCLSTPHCLKETDTAMQDVLNCAREVCPDAVLMRLGALANTTDCRKAYLKTLDNLDDAKRIYPAKSIFLEGELDLAAYCRKRISEGEAAALRRTLPLSALRSDREYQDLINTTCVYLLDCDSSITRTAEALFLHKNTIKYRLQRIGDLLGFRLGKMPETIELYRSAAIYRLLNAI